MSALQFWNAACVAAKDRPLPDQLDALRYSSGVTVSPNPHVTSRHSLGPSSSLLLLTPGPTDRSILRVRRRKCSHVLPLVPH